MSDAVRPGPTVLSVRDLVVTYGAATALHGISFEVHQGEVVTIIGGNGAGKTTTLRTVSGVSEVIQKSTGEITFREQRIDGMPAHRIAKMGLAHIPEGRRVFPQLSVAENLELGSFRRRGDRAAVAEDLADMYRRFPVLAERKEQYAGLLSGGEQQMLAIARGLMAGPSFLVMDEPSLGLAPLIVNQMFEIIQQLAADSGVTILLVEQVATKALAVADYAYVLESGAITAHGPAGELAADPLVKKAYLGG
ncbi:MAG: High-affinity branched-chain amino acid transport ATP-binding protein LivF [Acidimicrobiales bacterium]|nr:MAG: ABC transporter ATP-binding protein [Actinomycetota bacterium]MBV6509810.1 High-affinity branched-chain amino acid transport ATP-binding protein LivF [Acidimicrobiales bacterium]RIK04409.1 MAG: ABC transporter ATP-binding protein [Acidobacteriota bacterium]